jgi:3-oxoacyl-(acyl-carrier-protein) synthase
MYIRATGNISPQKTFGHPPFPAEPVEYSGSRLACSEPDYKEIIDAKLIRRMSRIIRMGVAAAMECLQEAAVMQPGAIITGTAYGCLEDTGLFLTKMIEFNEELLTPTAFIQSTHNTIGAQIGLMLQCNNYNNTFVHRGFSFESALLDGMMLLKEKEVANVLIGAVDEITEISHTILSRFGFYKQGPVSNLELYQSESKGTIAGEGASFFLLANEQSTTDYAKLDGLKTFYKPASLKEVEDQILSFLADHSITPADVDLVITGKNGDPGSDKIFDQLKQTVLSKNKLINYKHLCGEYPTSAAFALWMAAHIIKTGFVPEVLKHTGTKENKIKRILIYNQYRQLHHSLILIAAC